MSSIAVGPPVTPSDPLDRSALAEFLGQRVGTEPEVPFHAPPKPVRGRRVADGSRRRLAYVVRPAKQGQKQVDR